MSIILRLNKNSAFRAMGGQGAAAIMLLLSEDIGGDGNDLEMEA